MRRVGIGAGDVWGAPSDPQTNTGTHLMTACIVGWSHTRFGKLAGEDVESLICRVAGDALADAGITANAVDAVVLGHFNSGFSEQDFGASLAVHADPALRFKPMTRVENACATGSAAIHAGLHRIEAGRARFVLAIGVEKMTHLPGPEIGRTLLHAAYAREESALAGGFAGMFARIADIYFQRYGDQSDALAQIAAKNHRNGVANPYAQFRKDLGYAFCRTMSDKNPMVAGPLKRTDCSPVSDGAAAVVLADVDTASTMNKAVALRAVAHQNDYLPMSRRDMTTFTAAARTFAEAFDAARVSLDDLSFIELHDCFTIAELMAYEAMGLTPPGQGAIAIRDGWVEKTGRLPVNPSGGLKAKGHPIGATGVSMHVLACLQLCNQAEGMQIPAPKIGCVFNMGGSAVANYVSILERLR